MLPRFIAIDGPDGAGKTTLIRNLTQRLIAHNYPAFAARNPAGTKLGRAVRNLTVEATPEEEPSPFVQFHLQVAATAQLLREAYAPNIDKGFVLFDRYLLSLAVYQGVLPEAYFEDFVPRYFQATTTFPKPSLTVILVASPKVLLERLAGRNGEQEPADLMETEARINAQVSGFTRPGHWLPPGSNYMLINVEQNTEEQVLETVWSTVCQIWRIGGAAPVMDALDVAKQQLETFSK